MGLEEDLLAAEGVEETAPETNEPEVVTEETPTTEGAAAVVETQADEPAPVEAETPTETTEQQQNRLAAYIREQYGEDFSGKYKTDADLLKGLVHAAKKIGERDEEAQIGRFIRERPQEAMAWLQQQLGVQQPQQPQQPTSTTPEYDPSWEQDVEIDESGRAVGTKPGRDPTIAAKYNKAWDYARQRQRDLIFNTEKALEPFLSQAKQQAIQEARQQWEMDWQSRFGQMTAQQEAQQVIERNRSWMFNNGEAKPNNLTAAGRVYHETIQQWSQRRPDMSSSDLDELGRMAVKAAFPQQPAKPAAVKTPTRTTNVQTQTRAEELKPRAGESAFDFLTRVDAKYGLVKDD